ncbi:uncharacterized protein [Physcomitrium patens]|uniref:DUF7887 domain-containing protein n=1 Tax=Physcomitrium patens TaxID=3218 RepID=A0A2K1J358_PHYPA|nr:uncharacterized protein LOC112294090 isoform X1 [Physcomitrium patens]XP_024400009.1 uncharacterized protein LOC112294090 isoform X1 [Physcomitrium patens]PNR35965.1 hypothetical protein PHYPA_021815 [Physcomitrium patens]|eukprot:XP_024400008.1 uncharacterized protein LOC112294090 isoform X1 [Physcomitrella patens]
MAICVLIPARPLTRGATRIHDSRGLSSGPSSGIARFCSSDGELVSVLFKNRVAFGRELGFTSQGMPVFSRKRRVIATAQERDEDRLQGGGEKPFYAAIEFWIQAALVVVAFGFVDAGYSGDWSRIGALSPETEAQLRTAAYFVVPFSASVVWAIGKRKNTS